MEFTGFIKSVGPLETYQGKSGQTFGSRKIVVATEEKYPQKAVFTLTHQTASDFEGREGDLATVYFNLSAFSAPDGRTFNKLPVWRIDVAKQ